MIKHLLLYLLLFSSLLVSAQGTMTATQPITNATTTTGDSQGNTIITWSGSGNPEVGLVWSTAPINTTINPTAVAASNKTSLAYGWMASFNGLVFPASVSTMTGLTCNTTYYVRAYIRDQAWPGNTFTYSTEVSFTTPRVSISTTAISAITTTSATSGGNVSAVCGITATTRGICWNTAGTPTTADATATNGTGLGAYAANLTGLSGGIVYYVRAYVIGSDGIAYYGPQISFKTPFPAGTVSPFALTPEWYMGNRTGLTFPNGDYPNSGAPTAVLRPATIVVNNEASTSISYTSKAIALYSNSIKSFNSANTTATTFTRDFSGAGDNTCGGSSSGGALAVPNPAALDNQFYLFIGNDITGGTCVNKGTNAYTYQTTAGVTQYASGPIAALAQAGTAEAMAGGTDGAGGYWIVTHNVGNSNQYNIIHIQANGTVTGPTAVSKGRSLSDNTSPSSLKFSPCQDKIAYAASTSGVDVFYWDKATGTIGAAIYQGATTGSPNIEFSADGSMLYIGNGVSGANVTQVDLATGTSTSIGTPSWGMTLGPDGNIYYTTGGGIGKITNTNTTSASPTTITLPGSASMYQGLINLAFLSPQTPTLVGTAQAACTDVSFDFTFKNYFGTNVSIKPSNATINFGDGSPVVNNPTFPLVHTFPTSGGPYTVTYTYRDLYCDQSWSATTSATINCPAPVTWFNVDATPRNGGVDVYWATASEENTSYFVVQRSADGVNYENLGSVTAAGNSNSIREYGFVDPTPYTGTSYYRIVQYDIDGKYSTSRTVPVAIGTVYLNIYPNPSSGEFNVDLMGAGQATFIITDALGRVVYEKAFTGESISTQIGGDLANGAYVLTINTNNNSYHQKLVKK